MPRATVAGLWALWNAFSTVLQPLSVLEGGYSLMLSRTPEHARTLTQGLCKHARPCAHRKAHAHAHASVDIGARAVACTYALAFRHEGASAPTCTLTNKRTDASERVQQVTFTCEHVHLPRTILIFPRTDARAYAYAHVHANTDAHAR
eukprot:6186235-Pleurochrysis_carterae.AAC.2